MDRHAAGCHRTRFVQMDVADKPITERVMVNFGSRIFGSQKMTRNGCRSLSTRSWASRGGSKATNRGGELASASSRSARAGIRQACFVSRGVDLQDDRAECDLCGLRAGRLLLRSGACIVHGPMIGEQVWQDLDDLLKATLAPSARRHDRR